MTDRTRGALFPAELPRFTRVTPDAEVADLVEWYWVPEWDLPTGHTSAQRVLAYPATNLVVEPGGVALHGATTRVTERVLSGTGWAVGAVLRPAAAAVLSGTLAELVDASTAVDASGLAAAVAAVMPGNARRAAGLVGTWLDQRIGVRTPRSRLANDMARLLMTDAEVLRVEDAASRLCVSVRTLQRLAHRTVGLPPAAMIRRRRLQEAAQRVREHPEEPLADIAAALGYSDQAHLAGDFRAVLGFTASSYRG